MVYLIWWRVGTVDRYIYVRIVTSVSQDLESDSCCFCFLVVVVVVAVLCCVLYPHDAVSGCCGMRVRVLLNASLVD